MTIASDNMIKTNGHPTPVEDDKTESGAAAATPPGADNPSGTTNGPAAPANANRPEPGSKAPAGPPGDLPDPFDPAQLALGQNFADAIGVKKLGAPVPARKPHGQEWVRINPDPVYRVQTAVILVKDFQT